MVAILALSKTCFDKFLFIKVWLSNQCNLHSALLCPMITLRKALLDFYKTVWILWFKKYFSLSSNLGEKKFLNKNMHFNPFLVWRQCPSVNWKCNNTWSSREQSPAPPDWSECRCPWGWRVHRLWSPPPHNRPCLFLPEGSALTTLPVKCTPRRLCLAGGLWVCECRGLAEQPLTIFLSSDRKDGMWWRSA